MPARGTGREKHDTALFVLAKLPVVGGVKTRIAAALGAERACEFAAAFLRDSLARFDGSGLAPLFLAGDRGSGELFHSYLPGRVRYLAQGEGDLGERMARCFSALFALGFPRVIALGADTPHLPIELLRQAIGSLRDSEIVLGPSADGGFHLLGMNQSAGDPFVILDGLAWGTSAVLLQTRERIRALRIGCQELSTFWDIDDLEDLIQLQRHLKETQGIPGLDATTRLLAEVPGGAVTASGGGAPGG